MKRTFFSLIAFCIVLAACKKDHNVTQGDQKVTFSVGFSRTTGGFETKTVKKIKVNSTDTAVTNHVSVIYYMVFGSDGTLIHNVKQTSADTSFGKYTDNLKSGTYTVAIAAGDADLKVTHPGNLSVQAIGGLETGYKTADLYFKKIQVTVTNATVNTDVSLNRILSKLVLSTNDVIPAQGPNFAHLTVTGASNEFKIGSETGADNAANISIFSDIYTVGSATPLHYGEKLQMSCFLIYKSPLSVVISVEESSWPGHMGAVYAYKEISNINCSPNVVTTLSGNLFGGTGQSDDGFKLSIDSTWNSTPINKGF